MFYFKKKIQLNQHSQFFFFNFIIVTFLFIFFQSLLGRSEITDYLIFFFLILSNELIYILLAKKIINLNLTNKVNFFFSFFIFFSLLILWNYTNFFLLETLFLIVCISLSIFLFSIYFSIEKINAFNNENITYSFLLIGFLGFFYEFSLEKSILYFFATLIVSFILLKKKYKKIIDYVLSLVVILFFIKVFLLSSEKDNFHYAWYLGPIYSTIIGNDLLFNTVSQYGYLNLLFIKNLSLQFNLSPEKTLVGFIIISLFFFTYIFFKKIKKKLQLPNFVILFFISCLLLANIGYAELRGSIFIPSSSVFRFLPSILFYLCLNSINLNKQNNFTKIIASSFLFQISFFWSFESAVYTLFPLFGSIIFCLLHNYKKYNYFFDLKYFLIFLINLIIIILIFYKKDIKFFYEYAINFLESSASVSFKFNKFELLFFSILSASYFFWRESLGNHINNLFKNTYTFLLILIFSTIFLSRSHPNNLFTLMPFLIFLICCYKLESQKLIKFFLFSILFFTITSSIFSLTNNYSKLSLNLQSKNFFKTPNYLEVNFSNDLMKIFKENPSIPITIISGKTIHDSNNQINSSGFGLPILPLEQFNLLNDQRRKQIYSKIFSKNKKHIIVCVYKCNFYDSKNNRKSMEDIFLPDNLNIKKIFNESKHDHTYDTYLIEKK